MHGDQWNSFFFTSDAYLFQYVDLRVGYSDFDFDKHFSEPVLFWQELFIVWLMIIDIIDGYDYTNS